MNSRIESLVFTARTLEADCEIQLRFHHICNVNTASNTFEFSDGRCDPVVCRYDSLRLLEPADILEARLQALTGAS